MIPKTKQHVTGELISESMKALLEKKEPLFDELQLSKASNEKLVFALCGYALDMTDEKYSSFGFCDTETKIIFLDESFFRSKSLVKRTLLHEIAHAFQDELSPLDKTKEWAFSELLRMEWEAESVAYHLYNKHFGTKHHRFFNNYFSVSDVINLFDYYRVEGKDGIVFDIDINLLTQNLT